MTNLGILINEVFVLSIFFFSQSNHYRLSGHDCLTCSLEFFFLFFFFTFCENIAVASIN